MLFRRALLLLAVSAFSVDASPKPHPQKSARSVPLRVVGYFTEDGAASGKYPVKSVVTSGAAERLTQLDYAFALVKHDQCRIADRKVAVEHSYSPADAVDGAADLAGSDHLRGTFHQLQELKRLYPKLKILISLGGWGQSGGFSSAADPRHRKKFVRSCVDLFIRGQFAQGIQAPGIFDGIDLDWEYPVEGGVHRGHPADTRNMTALAAEFRRQLDAVRPGLLLTAAIPAEAELFKNFDLAALGRSLDQLSIMAYDLHWSTEPITNFHSALFHDPADPSQPPLDKHFGSYAVRGFLAAGVPRAKIILGVPFYSKGWSGVADRNHGLYQHATGPAPSLGYNQLRAIAGADRRFYPAVASCSLWSDRKFWSYDCPEALQRKLEYIRAQHLGGVMFWELSNDSPDSQLLRVLAGH